MAGVQIKIGADASAVTSAFESIRESIQRAGQAGRSWSQIDMSHPELQNVAQDLRTVQQNFEELQRVGRGRTAAAIRGGGYRDVLDFINRGGNEFADPTERAAFVRNAGRYFIQGTSYAASATPQPGGGAPHGYSPAGIIGGAARKAIRAIPGVGAAADGGIEAAGGGMGLAGGLATGGALLAVTAGLFAIREMTQGVKLAKQQAESMDTLTRKMGLAGAGFDGFRDNLHKATAGLMSTYDQMIRYTSTYAGAAGNASPGSALSGARVATGLARDFGMDPNSTASMMGTLQFRGAFGSNITAQKKFAAILAEAISQSGMYGKSGEVLAAITNFASTAERQMAAAPNIAAYASMLTSMNQSAFPGLHGDLGAAVLQTLDSAIRQGGNMGAASQNFEWRALNHGRGNLGVMGTTLLESFGAFGSEADTFKFLQSVGAPTTGFNPKDHQTNLSMLMAALDRQFPGKKNMLWRANAMGAYGIPMQDALALERLKPANLNGIQHLIHEAGIDPSKVSPTAFGGLAKITMAGHSMATLEKLRRDYERSNNLSGGERHALDSASTPKALRDALARAMATHGRSQDIGSKLIQMSADIKNQLSSDTQKLLSPLLVMESIQLSTIKPGFWSGVGKTALNGIADTVGFFQPGMKKLIASAASPHATMGDKASALASAAYAANAAIVMATHPELEKTNVHHVTFEPAELRLIDVHKQTIGSVRLKPVVAPPRPAGS